MKRLLSTLTALCMCASMSVGMLPASALSAISTDGAAVVRADSGIMSRVSADATHTDYEWSVLDTVYDPANPPADGYFLMPVNVWNDKGISGYEMTITVDGKELTNGTQDDFPFELLAFDNDGSTYTTFAQFTNGLEKGVATVASATVGDGASQTATQGGVAFNIAFTPKEGATFTPGAEYVIGFKDTKFSNSTGETLSPVLSTGILKIAGGSQESSESTPTPSESTPTPSESKPTPSEAEGDPTEYAWKIGKYTYNPAADLPDGYFAVPVNVWNDKGISGYEMTITINGKELPNGTQDDFPFELLAFDNDGSAYTTFAQFTNGLEKGVATVASATVGDGKSQTVAQGGLAYSLAFAPKDGATFTPGTKYTISVKDTKFSNETGEQLNPLIIDGAIIIAGGEVDPPEPPIADNYKWYIQDTEYDPASGEEIQLNVKVSGDPGTNGYRFGITIDGKAPTDADFPFVITDILNGDEAYTHISGFQSNPASGKVSSFFEPNTDDIAKEDGVAVVYILKGKDGVTYEPGKKYEVAFTDSKFGNAAKDTLFPTLDSGYITIIGETPEETTEPAPTETEPPFEHKQKEVDAKWVIGHDTVDAGAKVTIPVYVEGNTDGFNSYIADLSVEAGPVLNESGNGTLSDKLSFVQNADKYIFSGTDFTKDAEMVKGDGNVFYMTFTAPEKAGKYAIDFESLEVYDIDMVQLIPKTENGWIEVKAPETDFDHKKQDTAAKWVIGKVEIDAGTTTARVPVSVEGASDAADAINSYIAKIQQDKAGAKATGAEIGTAYAELGLQQNLKDLEYIFAGTSSTKDKENVTAADGVVFYIDFEIPADAAPGTIYNLNFADIDLENADMVQLIPTTENGWIKIKDAETTTTEKPIEIGDAGEWVIGTATVAPGEQVTIPVTVTGDKNGINSFIMKMGNPGIGGVTPTPTGSAGGDAYGDALNFLPNMDNMTFSGTNFTVKENLALSKDGATVFEVTFTAPTEPGKYDLTFEELSVYDINMSLLDPKKTDGWIEVVAPSETTTTEAPPESSDETTTTEAPPESSEETTTTTTEPIVVGDAGMWIIGTDTVDPGATVTIPVTVTGDKNGINSFIMKMGNAGLNGITPTPNSAAGGDAYGDALNFLPNIDNMTFSGTNFTIKENLALSKDGATVFEVTFTAPTEPGRYPLTFEELSVYDINMSLLDPAQQPGWIEVVAPSETTTTEEPVESSDETTTTTEAPPESSEETTTTTEAPPESSETTTTTEAPPESSETTTTTEPIVIGDAGMWIIGTDTVDPGATVTIPVTVTGDKNGINSFIMKMGNAGLNGITPTPNSAAGGDAYGDALNFLPNIDNMTFSGTNFTIKENLALSKDGATVFEVTFTAPTEPGVYPLTFEELSVYDINMSLLDPAQQPGWIEVVAPSETTTTEAPPESSDETTTTTEAPPESSDETTTTTEAPPESSDETTTTTEAPPESSETTTTTEAPPESSETTTTTEAPPEPSETTTTSEIVKPIHNYEVTWTIGKVDGVAGHPVEVPITVSADIAEALTYNLYDFKIKVEDGPVFNPTNLRSGSAYSEMTIQANGMEIAATNLNGDSVGYNNAVIIYLTFDLPEDIPAGKYAVEFDGDVEAHNRNLDTFDITEENGSILVIPDGVTKEQIEFQYDLESLSKFYFSHDHRTFIGDGLLKEDLISIGTLMARPVYSDPALTEEAEWTVADLDKIEFNLKEAELESPKAIFDTKVAPTLDDSVGIAFFKEKIAFTLSTTFTTLDAETGELVEKEQKDVDTLYDGSPIVTGDVYIGVKGDTNLNGVVNAADAAKDLVYAADFGAGLNPNILTVTSDMITAIQAEGEESATALENFVYFLSDVTDESEDHGATSNILDSTNGGEAINAADAARVLVYAAEFGAGLDPDWYEVLIKPLPKYTEAIGPRPTE